MRGDLTWNLKRQSHLKPKALRPETSNSNGMPLVPFFLFHASYLNLYSMLCADSCNALRWLMQCFAMSLAMLCVGSCNALRWLLQTIWLWFIRWQFPWESLMWWLRGVVMWCRITKFSFNSRKCLGNYRCIGNYIA